ncbi:MAG: precorrin-6y C5,15-methyltransferase (decarboxylating) subunit CbiE [Bacillota bacterium]|nr:precorrin-6y C5,15-methyltransferase (decarboxylating) subunit CbiE [Bacillota bacterium]
MIYIVGIGPGSKDYILPKAINTFKNSDIVLAFERAYESLEFLDINLKLVKNFSQIKDQIIYKSDKNIAIAASGDPCFYGINEYIKNNFSGDIEVIPGLSSFQYLCSKLGISWQNAYLSSLHGRSSDLIGTVKKYQTSIWLTDKVNTPDNICKLLVNNEITAKVYVGENLSYEDELITIGTPEEIASKKYSSLSVVIIEVLEGEN